MVVFMTLKTFGKYLYGFLQQNMATFIYGAGSISVLNKETVIGLTTEILCRILILIIPLLLISALCSFIITGIQTRFIFNTKHLEFKLSRLNPLSGMKRMVSARSYTQLAKSILTIVAIIAVIWPGVLDFSKNLRSFYFIPVKQSVELLSSSFYDIVIKVCISVIFIGILDYFIKWWQYEKDIKMSKQEIKDEIKMSEGDPTVKSAIRGRQQRMAQQRMMHRVPYADVVIVNPEHFAVAIKYDGKKNRAPVVIAKGKDNVALRIKEIAAQNDIRIEENPPLARAIYKAVEIDREIPPELYLAVAEVLSYVYSLKKKKHYFV
jgi:flagellar biosynthetic protein FlhB